MFTPTRTMAEWVSFRDHLPSGVSVTTCKVYTTVSTKNCNPSNLTYNNGQTWCSNGNVWISVQCPAGYHYYSRVATPFFPGVGNCMGNNVAVNAKINSEWATGNGYQVDFDAYNTTAVEHPTLPWYIWDRSGNNLNWIAVDYLCGGGSLTITCESN
jgi:hypothetical protein